VDPRVTVVIITRDRAEDLARTLERMGSLPERPQVIVVDNGSAPAMTEVIADRFPEVAILRRDRDEGAAARTAGVLAAATPYVAFSDDDSWWEPGALERAADVLDAHPDVGLLAARVELEGGRLEPVCAAMAAGRAAARPGLPGPPIAGFVACGAVVRRRAYLGAGGFEPGRGVGGEEQPLVAALTDRGWELVYVESVVAQHRPSSRRDPADRAATATRNDLLFAWRRRSRAGALRATAEELLAAARDRHRLRGVLQALREAPDALRRRRPVEPHTERRFAEITSGRRSGPSAAARRRQRP
jgi:GT2 family glycosyltransferase